MNINRDNKLTAFLEAGAYLVKIINAKYDQRENKVYVYFDICEGKFNGTFKAQYDKNPSNGWPKKAQKSFNLENEYGEKFLNQFIDDLENSNRYTYQNPLESAVQKWKGLNIAAVYKKSTYNGKPSTGFPEFIEVERFRKGGYSLEEEQSSSSSTQSSASNLEFEISDDDIQF